MRVAFVALACRLLGVGAGSSSAASLQRNNSVSAMTLKRHRDLARRRLHRNALLSETAKTRNRTTGNSRLLLHTDGEAFRRTHRRLSSELDFDEIRILDFRFLVGEADSLSLSYDSSRRAGDDPSSYRPTSSPSPPPSSPGTSPPSTGADNDDDDDDTVEGRGAGGGGDSSSPTSTSLSSSPQEAPSATPMPTPSMNPTPSAGTASNSPTAKPTSTSPTKPTTMPFTSNAPTRPSSVNNSATTTTFSPTTSPVQTTPRPTTVSTTPTNSPSSTPNNNGEDSVPPENNTTDTESNNFNPQSPTLEDAVLPENNTTDTESNNFNPQSPTLRLCPNSIVIDESNEDNLTVIEVVYYYSVETTEKNATELMSGRLEGGIVDFVANSVLICDKAEGQRRRRRRGRRRRLNGQAGGTASGATGRRKLDVVAVESFPQDRIVGVLECPPNFCTAYEGDLTVAIDGNDEGASNSTAKQVRADVLSSIESYLENDTYLDLKIAGLVDVRYLGTDFLSQGDADAPRSSTTPSGANNAINDHDRGGLSVGSRVLISLSTIGLVCAAALLGGHFARKERLRTVAKSGAQEDELSVGTDEAGDGSLLSSNLHARHHLQARSAQEKDDERRKQRQIPEEAAAGSDGTADCAILSIFSDDLSNTDSGGSHISTDDVHKCNSSTCTVCVRARKVRFIEATDPEEESV